MTRETWEEERDARLLARIEVLLVILIELIEQRLPAPKYRPTVRMVVTPK